MPFNGSGVFVRNYSWVTDQANAIQVNATRMDADTNDIANGLSQCVTKDGQSGALTANLQMGSNKITGLANGTANNDAVNFGQVFTAPTFTGITINGGTVTGTLNASGAASVLVPTPTLAGQAVNLSTLNAAVTAGGNAPIWVSGTTYTIGQLVFSPINFQTYRRKIAGAGTTDPSLDSTNWTFLGGSGSGGTTLTGNVTLTSASPAAMSVTPANPGLYVTLPDATTVSRSTAPFSVYNNGDFDYGVRDSAGTQLGWIRARTGAVIGLADNSTAAGVWAYYGLEKTGITASYVNSTLTNMGSTIRRIALDANRTCFLFGGADCYAIVYDASTQTWGSATLVRASLATNASYIGVLSSTNQVLVASCDQTQPLELVTLTISGTGITVNTGTKASTALAGNFASFGQLIAVGSSFVVSYGIATPQSEARAISVSGTTPTIGAAGTHGATSASAILFASGSIVRCVSATASSLQCKPYTVSGSTLSAGTNAVVTTTNASIRAFLNGNGRIVCHYINTTHFATIFSLSGTTETASSVSLGASPSGGFSTSTDYANIGASKTAFAWESAGANINFNILTDTAGTASIGTTATVSLAAVSNSTGYLATSGNFVLFGISSNNRVTTVNVNCSGASPTVTAVNTQSYATNDQNGRPQSTDIYGIRNPYSFITGTSALVLANAYGKRDVLYTPSTISAQPNPILVRGSIENNVNLTESNTSSIACAVNSGSTTGISIARIEAAA